MRLKTYPYKEIAINSAFLEIPAEYQRRLQMSKVKRMVAEFNGIIVNPPKVSYRDGRYIVIDGQHTIVGLKTLNGGKDLFIVCRVYTGLTKEEEALVFAEQTGASTPLSAGCVGEALPAAETAEPEQGQRSVFCKRAMTRAAKAGNRNPEQSCGPSWWGRTPSPTLSSPLLRQQVCSSAPTMPAQATRSSASVPRSRSSSSTVRTSTPRACGPLPMHGRHGPPRPVDETGGPCLAQRSDFCKRAPPRAAKTG